MRATVSIAFLVVLIAAATVGAETSWKCREVIDGDTLVAESDAGRVVRVNLFGIDAPELDQGRGAEAKAFVEEIALEKAITISAVGDDLAEITASVSVDTVDLAEALVRSGNAWLSKDGNTSEVYAIALFSARSEGTGLWSETEAEHPSQWRQRHRQPSPTPAPLRLSDIAASLELPGENGEPVVISDIPSAFTRNRETMRFVDMMLHIAAAVETLGEMEAAQARHCSGRQGSAYGDGDGSVWSEELNEWVDGTYVNREEACRALNLDISRGRGAIREAREEAIASARRFGVKDSTIREVLVYLDLQ